MGLTKKKKSISEFVYFSFMIMVILKSFLANTVIEYGWMSSGISAITFFLGICLTIKILSEWKSSWGSMAIIISIVTVGFIATSNFHITDNQVWEYILLILGARKIEAKKIIKYYLIVVGALTLCTVLASVLGIVDNLVFYRNEASGARYAMGFTYVTNFCAHLFFLCAAYAFLRGKNIKYIEILLIAVVGVACYVLSEGRNSTICIALLVMVLLTMKIIKVKQDGMCQKILAIVSIAFMPVLVVASIVLGFIYNPDVPFLNVLNKYMGHRPEMDAEAFSRYKITPFGQYFTQKFYAGRGGVGFPDNYFFIDCSYVSILLSMGALALIGIVILWSVITSSECKKKNLIGALVLSVVSIHCFMEQNILNIAYNPFFLLCFADIAVDHTALGQEIRNSVKSKVNTRVLKNVLSLIIFAVVVELLAFNMQSLTSTFNSYIQVNEYETSINGVNRLGNGSYEAGEVVYVVVNDVDEPLTNVLVNMNIYNKDDDSMIYNKEYSCAVYGYDEAMEAYQDITAATINTSMPASGYITLDKKYSYSTYMIAFLFDDEYTIEINKFAVNGPKPFDVSYLRIAIVYLVLVGIYYFGIEKRNAEVTPEVIEEAKANDQFVATGALRTEAHKNMRAVYEAKSPLYIGLKRFFDIVCSGMAILILSPIFIGTAIAIKLEDNGPVFFVQKRAGKNLKTFKMWKFRSMYVNADEKIKEMMANSNEQTGHAFKMKNDPRITKVGKFIRKFSIDELPQLFNIFLGDMSIVGPRPILVFQMEECDDYDKQRLIVQPGLTCIWQVSGRANIKWDKWIELDLEYIEKMSLWTDIKLILLTIPCVLSGDGAY